MTRRTDVIQIRVSEEEKEQIVGNARKAGKRPSEYLRHLGLNVVVDGAVPKGEVLIVSPPVEEDGPPQVGRIVNVASEEPRRFMCPKDCRPSFRPASDKVRCPDCMSRVVPEPE